MEEMIYQVESGKTFDEAVAAVEAQTQANGFRVLHIHDVQATLNEKGFEREPLKIVEVCNAKYANMALKIEVTVSLVMPCRINVYTENGKTIISTLRPTALVKLFGKSELEGFASEVDSVLRTIIDNSR